MCFCNGIALLICIDAEAPGSPFLHTGILSVCFYKYSRFAIILLSGNGLANFQELRLIVQFNFIAEIGMMLSMPTARKKTKGGLSRPLVKITCSVFYDFFGPSKDVRGCILSFFDDVSDTRGVVVS